MYRLLTNNENIQDYQQKTEPIKLAKKKKKKKKIV